MNTSDCILALETSARIGSVALARDSELIEQQSFSASRKHAGELLPVIDQLTRDHHLQPADIRQLYVSAGPGSFTGMRIAITAAKTLAFALDLKLVAVPSTDILIQNLTDLPQYLTPDTRVAAVLDAKRSQIYTAVYAPDPDNPDPFIPGFRNLIPPSVMTPDQLLEQTSRPLVLLGEGLRVHAPALTAPHVIHLPEPHWSPQARHVLTCGLCYARAGKFADPETLTPLYLRRPEAVEKWEQRHGPSA